MSHSITKENGPIFPTSMLNSGSKILCGPKPFKRLSIKENVKPSEIALASTIEKQFHNLLKNEFFKIFKKSK